MYKACKWIELKQTGLLQYPYVRPEASISSSVPFGYATRHYFTDPLVFLPVSDFTTSVSHYVCPPRYVIGLTSFGTQLRST